MSRGGPPTQPLSAVAPGVTESIAAADRSGQQRMATNNAAMAARNQEAIAREKMASQEFLTQEQLKNRMNIGLLQSADQARQNNLQFKMHQGVMQQRDSDRTEGARKFNEEQAHRTKVHDETMNMAKASQKLKLEMALADEYQNVDALGRLEESEKALMDRVVQMEAARKIQSGEEVDIGQLQTSMARQINEISRAQKPLIERGVAATTDWLANPDYDTQASFAGIDMPDWVVGPIGSISETILEVGTAFQGDFAHPRAEGKLSQLDDPDVMKVAQAEYFSGMSADALNAAFPEATGNLKAGLYKIYRNATIENSDEVAAQMQKLFSDSGVDPGVAGEILARVQEGVDAQRANLRSQGVTSNMDRGDIREDNVLGLIQQKLISSTAIRAAFSQLPSMSSYDAWAAGVTGSQDEVSEVLRQIIESGGDTMDIERLIRMMGAAEEGREEISGLESDLERARIESENLGTRMGVEQGQERYGMKRRALDEYERLLEGSP